ncbi:MAG TPA: hypothetical protein VF677_02020, partial [Flavobacterium sp.]
MKNLKNSNFGLLLMLLFTFTFGSCSTESADQRTDKKASVQEPLNDGLTTSRSGSTYDMKAFIFVKPNAHSGKGNVAVGYQIRTFTNGVITDSKYFFGGIENPQGAVTIPQGADNGGWFLSANSAVEMTEMMKNTKGYSQFKIRRSFVRVTAANVSNAYNRVTGFPARGFNQNGNNSINAVHEVL